MDLKQLRSFVQVADLASVSKAAERLHIAQPSLSLQIKSLEAEFGVQLLTRHSKGVTPTAQGRVLADHARKILGDVDQIASLLDSTTTNPTGRVAVGIPTSACRGLSFRLIDAARSRYPGIKVHIVEAMTGGLEEWIQSGKLDVALLYNHRPYENIAWTETVVEDLLAICPPDSDIASQKAVGFGDLARLPMTLPGRPNELRNVIEQVSAKAGIEANVAIDCDSLPGIVQLVRQGYVSILPEFAVQDEIARGEVVAVPIIEPTPSWRLSVVRSKATYNSHSSHAVAQLMAETIRAMVKSGLWRARL
jgi:DNA-binding transcriptional LysR family regulator